MMKKQQNKSPLPSQSPASPTSPTSPIQMICPQCDKCYVRVKPYEMHIMKMTCKPAKQVSQSPLSITSLKTQPHQQQQQPKPVSVQKNQITRYFMKKNELQKTETVNTSFQSIQSFEMATTIENRQTTPIIQSNKNNNNNNNVCDNDDDDDSIISNYSVSSKAKNTKQNLNVAATQAFSPFKPITKMDESQQPQQRSHRPVKKYVRNVEVITCDSDEQKIPAVTDSNEYKIKIKMLETRIAELEKRAESFPTLLNVGLDKMEMKAMIENLVQQYKDVKEHVCNVEKQITETHQYFESQIEDVMENQIQFQQQYQMQQQQQLQIVQSCYSQQQQRQIKQPRQPKKEPQMKNPRKLTPCERMVFELEWLSNTKASVPLSVVPIYSAWLNDLLIPLSFIDDTLEDTFEDKKSGDKSAMTELLEKIIQHNIKRYGKNGSPFYCSSIKGANLFSGVFVHDNVGSWREATCEDMTKLLEKISSKMTIALNNWSKEHDDIMMSESDSRIERYFLLTTKAVNISTRREEDVNACVKCVTQCVLMNQTVTAVTQWEQQQVQLLQQQYQQQQQQQQQQLMQTPVMYQQPQQQQYQVMPVMYQQIPIPIQQLPQQPVMSKSARASIEKQKLKEKKERDDRAILMQELQQAEEYNPLVSRRPQ